MIEIVSKILAIMTVLTDGLIILFMLTVLISAIWPGMRPRYRWLLTLIRPLWRPLALLVAVVATGGSLFFSDVVGYSPCILCWWQRIFMYSQVPLLVMGIIKNDKNIADYVFGLSVIGGSISAFHYYTQVSQTAIIPCSTIGFAASCNARFALEYGYVSIPMMALSAFVALVILSRIGTIHAPQVKG